MSSASAPFRPRRDRRGRGQRGPMAWPPVPAMATRAQAFDELVLDAASRMEHHAGTTLGDLEFAVEDVPPSDPAPWESSEVPLGRLFAAQGKMPARIVVYRRPVETRTNDTRELAGVDTQQGGHLLDDNVVDQGRELAGIVGPGLDRPAVDHDASRHLGLGSKQPSEGHFGGLPWSRVTGWYVLDRELQIAQRRAGVVLHTARGVKDELVECLRSGSHRRHGWPSHWTPLAPAAAIAARAKRSARRAHGRSLRRGVCRMPVLGNRVLS